MTIGAKMVTKQSCVWVTVRMEYIQYISNWDTAVFTELSMQQIYALMMILLMILCFVMELQNVVLSL